jgi:hypothetical protein
MRASLNLGFYVKSVLLTVKTSRQVYMPPNPVWLYLIVVKRIAFFTKVSVYYFWYALRSLLFIPVGL